MSMMIVAGVGMAVSAGVGVYGAVQQGKIAGQQMGMAQNTQQKQNQAWGQLQDLITNPKGFLDSPLYQAAFGQGTQAVARGAAAGGFLNSGNAAAELHKFGQGFAGQQLMGQEELLAGLSGAGSASSPAQSASVASSASSASFGEFGGVLAGLGYSQANFGAASGSSALGA